MAVQQKCRTWVFFYVGEKNKSIEHTVAKPNSSLTFFLLKRCKVLVFPRDSRKSSGKEASSLFSEQAFFPNPLSKPICMCMFSLNTIFSFFLCMSPWLYVLSLFCSIFCYFSLSCWSNTLWKAMSALLPHNSRTCSILNMLCFGWWYVLKFEGH